MFVNTSEVINLSPVVTENRARGAEGGRQIGAGAHGRFMRCQASLPDPAFGSQVAEIMSCETNVKVEKCFNVLS